MIDILPVSRVGFTDPIQPTRAPKNTMSQNDAMQAAKEFESIFLSQIFGLMFSGISTDGVFGGGQGEKMWRGFLVDHIAEAYTERNGLGIAQSVMEQIIEMSEASE